MVVLEKLYNSVNIGEYISINLFTKEAPYDYHETPMVLTFTSIVDKRVEYSEKILIIDYYSPYNYGL